MVSGTTAMSGLTHRFAAAGARREARGGTKARSAGGVRLASSSDPIPPRSSRLATALRPQEARSPPARKGGFERQSLRPGPHKHDRPSDFFLTERSFHDSSLRGLATMKVLPGSIVQSSVCVTAELGLP
jgi:hypothetical protein